MRFAHICVALVLVIAAALPAAPILSTKQNITDDYMSVADLRELRVHVFPLRARFKDLGVRRAKLETLLQQELEESGFKIVTDTKAPRCVLRIVVKVDERFPDVVCMGTLLEIEQRVKVHRVERDLKLATAALIDVFMTRKADASKDLKSKITLSVAHLANMVGTASAGE